MTIEGYLAHKKTPITPEHRRILCIGLLSRGVRFLMGEATLQGRAFTSWSQRGHPTGVPGSYETDPPPRTTVGP